ncbi:MAG: hypothetical protein ACLGSD_00275 [Acidobacteriota bacterium]
MSIAPGGQNSGYADAKKYGDVLLADGSKLNYDRHNHAWTVHTY